MRNLFLLLFVLLLAFYMAFIPHIGYAYPLHVDEWMHMTYAETIAQSGSITFPDPFTGLTDIKLGDNLWVGFHLLWAMFQQVSGISWIPLFRYVPSIIFMITVLAVYILASRQGFGWEAAFFTCLIPTTGGLLGPAFMVPMALGMLFIPLSLFLAYHIRHWGSYVLLFIFTCFLLLSHATTAIIICIILAPYILLNFKGNTRHSVGILVALGIPFILPFPWILQKILLVTGQLLTQQSLSPYIELPDLLAKYGLLPVILSFIGTVVLVIKGGKKALGLVLGLALLLIIMLVFIRFHYGLATIYERGLTAMLLIMSILAGAGLSWLSKLKLPANFLARNNSSVFRSASPVICALLIIVILVIAVPTRVYASFYHMIDDEDYNSFVWIKDHVGTDYASAIVDPWKATAFTAITGKKVASRIWFSTQPVDVSISRFLAGGCRDTTFLGDYRGSLVYNLAPCSNSNLVEVRNNIYISNPNILSAEGKNMLSNAGFEAISEDPPVYWGKWFQNCEPTFMFPEHGRNDGVCVSIHMVENGPFESWPQAIWGQNVPVQAGKSYIIGGWIRSELIDGSGGAMIVPHWKGPGDAWISATEFMPYFQGTTGWAYYEGKVTAPEGASICTICLSVI
ncbi:MAG: hypothetical protein NTZ34_07115 [Chloroflexi bacterium]|nr:hypothetical protein [Chloroflexota bacterium]